MGRRTLSWKFLNMFRPKKFRYHRISGFSDSQTQALVHNHDRFMEPELEHDVQALSEKFSALENEIVDLKSDLSWLAAKLQTKIFRERYKNEKFSLMWQDKEGNNQQEAITSLGQKVDKLKKRLDIILAQTKAKEGSNNQQEAIISLEQRVDKLKNHLDGIILEREAQKKMDSNEITKQGGAIIKMEENNSNLEKKVAELETRVKDMTSSMVDLIALVSELKDENSSNSNPQVEAVAKLPDMIQISERDLVTICFLILVFMGTYIIGKNL